MAPETTNDSSTELPFRTIVYMLTALVAVGAGIGSTASQVMQKDSGSEHAELCQRSLAEIIAYRQEIRAEINAIRYDISQKTALRYTAADAEKDWRKQREVDALQNEADGLQDRRIEHLEHEVYER